MRFSYFDPGTDGLKRVNSVIETFGKSEEVQEVIEQTAPYSPSQLRGTLVPRYSSPQVQQALQRAKDMASKLGVHIFS